MIQVADRVSILDLLLYLGAKADSAFLEVTTSLLHLGSHLLRSSLKLVVELVLPFLLFDRFGRSLVLRVFLLLDLRAQIGEALLEASSGLLELLSSLLRACLQLVVELKPAFLLCRLSSPLAH